MATRRTYSTYPNTQVGWQCNAYAPPDLAPKLKGDKRRCNRAPTHPLPHRIYSRDGQRVLAEWGILKPVRSLTTRGAPMG